MSHTVKVKTQVKQLPELKRAFESCDWDVRENTRLRGRFNQNDIYSLGAISPLMDYRAVDVQINKKDGAYEILALGDADHLNQSLETLGGKSFNVLKKNYALEVLKDKAAKLGYELESEQKNGTIKVKITAGKSRVGNKNYSTVA